MLVDVIQHVLEVIYTNQEDLNRNEMEVRYQLVDPILKELGWNLDDPTEVKPENITRPGRADYALLKGRRPFIFIETKNLSINIESENHLLQAFLYCWEEGVEFGILTNGAKWLIFKAFENKIPWKERIFMKLDLKREDPEAASPKLEMLRKGSPQLEWLFDEFLTKRRKASVEKILRKSRKLRVLKSAFRPRP